jgi:IPT/TIG domain
MGGVLDDFMMRFPSVYRGLPYALVVAALATIGGGTSVQAGPVRSASPSEASVTATTPPGYLTIVLGRTLYAKVASCKDPTVLNGMMTIDQVVSHLATLGVAVTGPVIPDRTPTTGTKCVNGDLYPSWAELAQLRDTYGLTAVSATQSYADLTKLTTQAQFQQTCGSLSAYVSHGHHRAWGLLAYPNNHWTTTIQSTVVDNCFAFGRTYKTARAPLSALTNYQSTMAAPWFQVTLDVGGGRCNDATQPCSTYNSATLGVYASPIKLASVTNVAAGTWTAMQFYTFVTGNNLSGPLQWDCSNSDWHEHWASRFEIYCWNDFVYALSRKPARVVIADPATVAEAWGRIPTPLVTIDSSPTTVSPSTPTFSITWHSPENGAFAVFVGGNSCSSGSQQSSGTYSTSPSPITTTLPTSALVPGPNDIRICLTNDASHQGSATTSVTLASSPSVSSVVPSAGPLSSGTAITITGTNFTSDAAVSVGGVSATGTSLNSSTSLGATAPAAASAGSVDVVVTEGAGSSAISNADKFFYEAPPSLAAVQPSSGSTAGGDQVTLSGSNFYPDASVQIGGRTATVVSVSATAITVITPASSAGPADVAISEAGGTTALSGGFDYA